MIDVDHVVPYIVSYELYVNVFLCICIIDLYVFCIIYTNTYI